MTKTYWINKENVADIHNGTLYRNKNYNPLTYDNVIVTREYGAWVIIHLYISISGKVKIKILNLT